MGGWRGQVQHIQSGEWASFHDEATLLDFLRRWVQTPISGDPSLTEGSENASGEDPTGNTQPP